MKNTLDKLFSVLRGSARYHDFKQNTWQNRKFIVSGVCEIIFSFPLNEIFIPRKVKYESIYF